MANSTIFSTDMITEENWKGQNSVSFSNAQRIDICIRPNTFFVGHEGCLVEVINACPINSILHGALKLNQELDFFNKKSFNFFSMAFINLAKIVSKGDLNTSNTAFHNFITCELKEVIKRNENVIDCETSIFSVANKIIEPNIELKCVFHGEKTFK